MPDHEIEDHDRGLSHDLPKLLSRRRALTVFGGLAVVVAGCGTDSGGDQSGGSPSAAATTPSNSGPARAQPPAPDTSSETSAGTGTIPEETGGPFPADGSNGVNVLTESGIVRSDIRASFGSASGVAEGVPLTVKLRVLDTSNGSVAYPSAAVYLWHCDRDGKYSLYSEGITEENYLRGVQVADSAGWVTFRTTFPAAYSGRWPHIHFEVYPDVARATTASGKLRTTQLALPEESCQAVYANDGYEQSVQNLDRTSLESDNVFRDGYSLQLAKISGTVDGGLTATLNVPV